MSISAIALLCASIMLSSGRNILSRSLSGISQDSRAFYLLQGMIFSAGAVILICSPDTFVSLSPETIYFSLIYGALLILAQWNYTAALAQGNTGVCVTVYSLGFVLPTVSGMIFWGESVSLWRIIGILIAASAVLVSGRSRGNEASSKKYILPLFLAMLSSGGLGIMQKVQQSTAAKDEKNLFILLSFLLAGAISFIKCGIVKNKRSKMLKGHILSAVAVGVCFSVCNLLNTILAGMLDTAVFFPLLNVSSILFSLILSVLIFRERPDKKSALVLILGIAAILLINIG